MKFQANPRGLVNPPDLGHSEFEAMFLASLRGTLDKDAISVLCPERNFPIVDAQLRISDACLFFVFACIRRDAF